MYLWLTDLFEQHRVCSEHQYLRLSVASILFWVWASFSPRSLNTPATPPKSFNFRHDTTMLLPLQLALIARPFASDKFCARKWSFRCSFPPAGGQPGPDFLADPLGRLSVAGTDRFFCVLGVFASSKSNVLENAVLLIFKSRTKTLFVQPILSLRWWSYTNSNRQNLKKAKHATYTGMAKNNPKKPKSSDFDTVYRGAKTAGGGWKEPKIIAFIM